MAKLLSIRVRLILLVLVPSILYLGTSIYLLQQSKSHTEVLASTLYETTDKSTSLILNADRDMYQALAAYQLLVSGTLNAEDKTKQLKVLAENIEQTNTWVGQAHDILKAKGLLQVAHMETKATIDENVDGFQTSFDQWVKEANTVVQSGAAGKGVINDAKLTATFEKGREGMNQIGEILDDYAKTSIEEIQSKIKKTEQAVYISIALLILVLTISGGIVISTIMRTVKAIMLVTSQVAAGDLRHEAKTKYAKDELGKITESVDTMVLKIKGLIGTIAHNTQFVQDASVELSDSSKESASAAEHVATNIQEMTHDVEAQARSSQETSRAIEEMAIGIQRVAENSSVMADHSSLTSKHATMGNDLLSKLQQQIANMLASVEQLSQTVLSLTRKSDQIGLIASSITTFANQTNLLSLNASIEAARAGEHGKGFNVVANEIRKLAAQSIESADGINQLIHETRVEITSVSESMNATKQEAISGSTMMQEVNQSFHTIMASVTQIVTQIHETSAITEQMSASSEEISATMDQSASSTTHILMKSQNVAAATEQQLAMMQNIAAASEQLRSVVNTLNESVAYFKIA
ncbi:methyl-accepting chemotaxis protein [Paenibacillus alba]|uniref:HAMP domain-containing methyl-accepting chemotaxis protein n=1 Tax=Paenibacillus alba TaxID=1197127 RepID=A0ABU6G1E9_9BACL|nr:HAMP domain-containing methyl-accepting chemotaxis protein [Paenibacillus alba]MEC0227981.1 HAMP domain-containing methyl-accepting chemotaxis protein [Paenibacillus alba]